MHKKSALVQDVNTKALYNMKFFMLWAGSTNKAGQIEIPM